MSFIARGGSSPLFGIQPSHLGKAVSPERRDQAGGKMVVPSHQTGQLPVDRAVELVDEDVKFFGD